MVVPAIPPEILERILDEIAPESIKPTLCAAALVSRTFRVEAQRALFFDPGLLVIGDPDQHHNCFIDAILSSPDRLALLVRRYRQLAVAEGPLANVWVPYFHPARGARKRVDELQINERRMIVTKVAQALRLMTNLKHLALQDRFAGFQTLRYSMANQLLQECTFKLESFSWDCREEVFTLVTKILITQDQLRYLHLHAAYNDRRLTDEKFRDAAKNAFPMLDSLSAPFSVSEVLIPEKRIKFLRWIGGGGVEIADIPHLAALCFVELLDLNLNATSRLSSMAGYLTNLKLLKVDLFGRCDETEAAQKLGEICQLTSLRMLVLRPSSPEYSTVVNAMDFKQLFVSCKLLQYVDVQDNDDSLWILRRSVSKDRTEIITAHVPLLEMYNWERRADFL